jgi:2-polyprenyl-3-methyl-5-hydroxy-6-metoxy-1,4-benzoquinol methylase
MNDTRGAYRDDLAYIHDAGFLAWVNSAAPAVLSALRKNGIRRGLVVDVGCGSGVLAEKLTAAGFDVLGIDISPAMIAIARHRAPRATFVVGSLSALSSPAAVRSRRLGKA